MEEERNVGVEAATLKFVTLGREKNINKENNF
jgi:hypothetical protein